MSRQGIDSEIQKRNYERELLLCQKAGGDVEKYRHLSFDVLQLEQIRKGLESGVDVSVYLDPKKSWLEMEETRISMESGFPIQKYIAKGYDRLQCAEIREGIQEGVDVSWYLDVNYLAPQMREIRKGLKRGIKVKLYADPQFDWFQMREIRKGLEEKIDASLYAQVSFKHTTMRAVRKGLQDGINLLSFAKKGYSGKVLQEIMRGIKMNYNISEYLEEGYDAEQLHQINYAHEIGVNILPFLKKEFHGVQLQEIIKGLEQKLDVSQYADVSFNWFQMREIRYGLENRIDVKLYTNPEFSQRQMEEIRKGLEEGIDVSQYAKLYYEPEQMEEIREKLEQTGAELTEEMEKLLRSTMPTDMQAEDKEKAEEEAEEETDIVFDSCITIAEDKMSALINFSQAKEMRADELSQFTVPDVVRLLRKHDIKQGLCQDRISEMINDQLFDVDIIVAQGKKAVNGKDGVFKYYFRKNLDRRPRVLEDGTVDYKNMELFEAVKKDVLIAEYIPATMGVFGYDVTGKILAPMRGKELPPLRGTGFFMTEDKKKYYSQINGIIELDELDNRLDIRNLYLIPGDVDASIGNIDFNGDINIMGNVQSGFSITAAGNIVIDGHCEGCQIQAGKDVIIRKGFQGRGVGKITAGGEITGRFFESAILRAEGDIEASYLLNCQLYTTGKLLVEGRKGVIIGGTICAKQGVVCSGIGNIAEIKTLVEVGIDKEDMASYQELLQSIDKVDAELKTCETALKKFMAQPTRDEKATALIQRLNKAVYSQKTRKKKLIQDREKKMEIMTKQKGARIQVNGRIYPGTLLYLNSDPFVVKEVYVNVDFVKHDNQIDTVNR